MNLKKVLTVNSIITDLSAESKEGVISEMVDFMADSGKIKNRDAALSAVLEREKKMSTGMQHGVAIPHGKTDCVDQLIALIGIHRTGVDFDAMDGNPCFLFIMTLSPANRTGPHIQFLAEISKLLSNSGLRDRLLQADSAEQILALLTA
jgi:fructose-specific phosphotransferase system IIA component